MPIDDMPQAMPLLEAMNAALPIEMLLGDGVQGVLSALRVRARQTKRKRRKR